MNPPETNPNPAPHALNLRHAAGWIRNKFVTGLFVILPLAATLWVLGALYRLINSWAEPIVVHYATVHHGSLPSWIQSEVLENGRVLYTIPGAGFFLTIAFLVGLGALVSNFAGKRLLTWMDQLLQRMPVASTIYNAAKQLVDAVQTFGKSDAFKSSQVVLVRYPGTGARMVAFKTGRFMDTQGRTLATLLVPSSPSPITAFILIVPEDEVEPCDMRLDEATKLILSGGLVTPRQFTFPPASEP